LGSTFLQLENVQPLRLLKCAQKGLEYLATLKGSLLAQLALLHQASLPTFEQKWVALFHEKHRQLLDTSAQLASLPCSRQQPCNAKLLVVFLIPLPLETQMYWSLKL
jgi:hypothetical protein